ncbi:M protein repeat protein [Aspergillus arachidicola]|uniref:AP-1 complex subunit sigma-1 n=1 Tax=Aspergillus arachidicola TaxID=656916 RepID=A0A2G7G4I0_9EURO|nr:M protein repeat protein [Aspergillus arachidicola]
MAIHYLILLSRQGKVRLAKWFTTLSPKEKAKIIKDVTQLVLSRRTKMCNFLEYKDSKVVYRRYASLFFIAGCASTDNELITLEVVHRYVEQMDKYYGNVCELDIIFNFQKAYFILDELLLAGEMQESSKKNVLRCISQQDSLEDMEFLPLPEIEDVTSSLNFDTGDCHILGGCDLYTTKAARADRKLYKNIEQSLEAQYESTLRLSASLSPPNASDAAASLNLSRSSPFGPLSDHSSRRTFAYLIATLNASHPDYDFSHVLRPSDFHRERNIKRVMNTIDSTLFNLRPREAIDLAPPSPVTISGSYNAGASATWGPKMWQIIDEQLSLNECSIYSYSPEEDPSDADDGAIWSLHYFFLTVSGSVDGVATPTAKRTYDDGYLTPDLGSSKRARYWLGDVVHLEDESESDEEHASKPARPAVDEYDNYMLSDEEFRSRSGSKGTTNMADDEERTKAEKLAAAKKRVAQLQKQKKKANKKTSGSEASTAKEPKESSPSTEDKQQVEEAQPQSTEESKEEPTPTDDTQEKPEDQQQTQNEPEPPHTEQPTSPTPSTEPQPAVKANTPSRHGRQPSLSIQSKMRSSSFRKGSVSQGSASPSPSAMLKSPSLPPLTADGESVHEVYRKQAGRIEEVEKENRRLEKELEEATNRWKKTEEQLEEFREASVDVAELKEKLAKAEEKVGEVEELKAEIASLQRQNSHLQKTHRSTASPASSESPPADLVQQLESKSATIEAMELEISNLRAQLTDQSSSSSALEAQIKALEQKLESRQGRSGQDVHRNPDQNLERELSEVKESKSESEKKIETLEKKIEAMGNLHKESETRHQARMRESEKTEQEVAQLRSRLASAENENLRLKEEQETLRKRNAVGADDDGIDELEDEERSRLERRIRDLEGEIFDLRRGVWKEKREEIAHGREPSVAYSSNANQAANAFDDVDLVGGAPEHARQRSMQQHSSFSTVLSSGLAAFTGGNTYGNRARAPSNKQHPSAARGSLELLSEENFDDEFDEAEFARAQAEEEARKRVEWVREIKKKLKDWHGWRLDLVDSRAGAEGAGVGMGEIFEI